MAAMEGSPRKRRRYEKRTEDRAEDTGNDDDDVKAQCDNNDEDSGADPRPTVNELLGVDCGWREWTVQEVAQRMQDCGIPRDATNKFKENKIDGKALDSITPDHIRNNLNIQELGTQLKIQQFLDTLHSSQTKVFNDPVHGHMEIHPLCVALMDTPQFQRLRYLKQLGACYFVYPGASHNRFEHSLGVCHLAGQLVRALQKRQPLLGITDRDVLCVQIAGLCHDLGHGPFSHMFDNKFIPFTRPERQWKHEEGSILMFDHLVKQNDLEPVFEQYGLREAERIFVKEQISGENLTTADSGQMTKYYGPESNKSFLYEVVANKKNGVDVDKWDYFKRDCLHLGIQSSFDHTRFIQFSRVIQVGDELQICVRDKEAFNMYEMFHTRHALHRRAYQHRVVQAVEIMLVEAMKEADQYILTPGTNGEKFTISQCIDDMEAFTQLTDTVFQRILLSVDEPGLDKARSILQDIQRRKLYRCVSESEPITKDHIIRKQGDVIKTEILEELGEKKEEVERLELITSTFVVQIVSLDYGKNTDNPVNNLRFFTKEDRNRAKAVRASEVSFLIPQDLFKEQLVRLFLRPSEDAQADEQRLRLLHLGFKRWCASNNLQEPKTTDCLPLTPYRPDQAAADNERTPDRPVALTKPSSLMKARQSLTF